MNYAQVCTTANADNVTHHCVHGDGTSSYKITGTYEDVTVYLVGTPAEIIRFATALRIAARAQAYRERKVVN